MKLTSVFGLLALSLALFADQKPEKSSIRATATTGSATALGIETAPVTIVEFTDYQCPYCQRFYLTIFPLLKRDFIDTGKVRLIAFALPIVQIHPYSLQAAIAAACAGQQGQFWQYRDRLQRNNAALATADLVAHATALNLDARAFRTCLDDDKSKIAVEAEARAATESGVNATPSFLVGTNTAGIVEGELIAGALPYEMFSAKIKVLLNSLEQRGAPADRTVR